MSSDLPLKGRHALVTGGGTGIGAAIARELSGLGARLTLVGRRLAPLQTIIGELGEGLAISCDITQRTAVETAFKEAIEEQGAITVLINNAGAAESAPILRSSEALLRRMFDVNVMGTFHCSQVFLAQEPLPQTARIVNVASTAALTGYAYVSAYCAAKHAVLGFTRALARELARLDITVNAVCPGYTETSFLDRAIDRIVEKTSRPREEIQAQMVNSNPQGRFVQPHEVAASVAWLALPTSAAINGQAIIIAGGELM